MEALLSWLMTQSGVSLLVALIALGGVLLNNRAAEKRRKRDQEAADQRRRSDQNDADRRRREDQLAEVKRREAEFAKRKLEQLRSLEFEDAARQRRFVQDFVKDVQDIDREFIQYSDDAFRSILRDHGEDPKELYNIQIELGIHRKDMCLRLVALVKALSIEITEQNVSNAVEKILEELMCLMECIEDGKMYLDFDKISLESLLKSGLFHPPHLSSVNELIKAAKEHLQPVTKFIEENN